MNTISNFLASAIVGGWIMTMAVFAIQNIQPVSLKFLQFEFMIYLRKNIGEKYAHKFFIR